MTICQSLTRQLLLLRRERRKQQRSRLGQSWLLCLVKKGVAKKKKNVLQPQIRSQRGFEWVYEGGQEANQSTGP
jgi:hypothetical protein